MSATVMPRWNAATLMRPRSSGVTSIVSRAVKRSAFAPLFEGGSGVRTQVSGSLGRAAKRAFGIAGGHRAIRSISAASAAISRIAASP